MQLTSANFQHEGKMPVIFTCDGENRSPELSWRDAPPETKSFVLIMHDPDAPKPGGFTHWVLFDIPGSMGAIEPNVPSEQRIPSTGIHGKNDSGNIGYTGPCPPSGTHRYFIHFYALDTELHLAPGASSAEVKASMEGHILEHAELMATYARLLQKAS